MGRKAIGRKTRRYGITMKPEQWDSMPHPKSSFIQLAVAEKLSKDGEVPSEEALKCACF